MTVVRGDRIQLRPLEMSDTDGNYSRWVQDPEVTRYLAIRFQRITAVELKQYVQETLNDPKSHLFAIIQKEKNRHIGNIKIGPVDSLNRVSYMGLMIGEKSCWNQGYATEAIRLACEYAFQTLKLHKLMAGCIAHNTGSIRAFLKAGFVKEGVSRKEEFLNGEFVDAVILGLLSEEFMPLAQAQYRKSNAVQS